MTDPRRDPDTGRETGVRPVVARPSGGPSPWLIGSGAVLAGLALFLVLDRHRQAVETPAVRIGAADRATAAGSPAPPPLYVLPPPAAMPAPITEAPPASPQPIVQPAPPAAPRIVYLPQPPSAAPAPLAPAPARRGGDETALVIDTTVADGAPAAGQSGGDAPGANANTTATGSPTTAAPNARVRAIMLADRATTVPQGTLIPAVLETAFDSTRPGLARALVSRDVRGFDGSRVLVPRGSRLTGDYRSDAASGQNRALIIWTRLVRPDGATIALASPVADTLGRGGVKAKVDSHFLARFTGAILQTALAVGVNLASRPSSGTVVLGLPGSTLGGANLGFTQQQVTNTLTVRAGTSIGVFVSRDLDFADVEGVR